LDNCEEKRMFERFYLGMSAIIRPEKTDTEVQALTTDISAGGAFFQDVSVFQEGMKLKIELIIGNETVKKLTGSISRIKLQGKVVRCTGGGAAVRFQDNYEIIPLRSRADN
jgi:hypothetical protein